ncbi:MAG: hypothetical protein ACRYG2_14510, partial [Janthinobacterium lividum]
MAARLVSGLAAGTATAAAALTNAVLVRQTEAPWATRWLRTNHVGAPVTLLEGPVATASLVVGCLVEG